LSFKHLNLIEPLLKALDNEGYTIPTPIQEQAIPIILNRKDLLGCAQTGTGKTAAFALPLLQLMCEDAAGVSADTRPGSPRPIRALVLTPTRELAIQIDESFGAYGKFTGIRHTVIFGGVPQHSQVQALQKGVDVLVATPGRLLDLIDQRYVHLQHLRYFVLDEADRMLDMGFINDIRKVLTKLPPKRHSLFFSATMPPEIQKLANTILVNPLKVEVTPEITTAETVQQSLYFVEKKDKRSLLLHILKDSSIPTALVFTRTKHGADKVAQGLVRAGIRAEAIHGNKSQNARQRALESFKNRQIRILVATDIAARGIDIDELTHVINFELPNVPETYVHRIGRTGRAGASGTALSFCDQEEKEYLRDIQKLIARNIPVVENHPHVMVGGLPYHAPVASRPASAGRNGGERRIQQSDGRRREEPKRNGEIRRPAEQKRTAEVKRPEEPKRNAEVKRPAPAEPKRNTEIKRPAEPKRREEPRGNAEVKGPEEAKRLVKLKRNGEVKPPEDRKPYEPTNFSIKINRSEGDEKW
jgi:ATP-dependent RNA helicase RhlE